MSERVDRVKALLRQRDVVCSLLFYDRRRTFNDRNAVSELKAKRWHIEAEHRRFNCTDDPDEPVHAHYRLISEPPPEQLAWQAA